MFDQLQNQNVIINTDIDGILSGLILHNFLNCEIVGFSNSWDTVWYNKNKVKIDKLNCFTNPPFLVV